MKKKTLLIILTIHSFFLLAQHTKQDSLMQFLTTNENAVKGIVNNYKQLNLNWATLVSTFAGVLVLGFIAWKTWLKTWFLKQMKIKAQEMLESMIDLKKINILVLSSYQANTSGNEAFIKSFFKAKKFSNVSYAHIKDTYVSINNFDYDVVFANNEDNLLDKAIIRKYIDKDQILFYFGKSGTWDFINDTAEISKKINFANSRAQIYGNLMSSLEYLQCVKPIYEKG